MEKTARYDLPLLAVAQAAKEMTLNEALVGLDVAVQPVVRGIVDAPPAAPDPGEAWIVGETPTGAFVDHAHDLAAWTIGGWRFISPFEGMTAWRTDTHVSVRWRENEWTGGASIAPISGGAVIDSEARAAIETIVARLRLAGLTAA
jgi:hypothetical protein